MDIPEGLPCLPDFLSCVPNVTPDSLAVSTVSVNFADGLFLTLSRLSNRELARRRRAPGACLRLWPCL